jgi:hypothetical protein
MRAYLSVWSLLLICFLSACGPGKTKVDSAALTPAFSGASADVQGQVSTIVSAVTANDYEKALGPLRTVITKGKITDEQRAALTTILADMQRVVVENQDDFSMDVYNGLNDLVGVLAGNPPINM